MYFVTIGSRSDLCRGPSSQCQVLRARSRSAFLVKLASRRHTKPNSGVPDAVAEIHKSVEQAADSRPVRAKGRKATFGSMLQTCLRELTNRAGRFQPFSTTWLLQSGQQFRFRHAAFLAQSWHAGNRIQCLISFRNVDADTSFCIPSLLRPSHSFAEWCGSLLPIPSARSYLGSGRASLGSTAR